MRTRNASTPKTPASQKKTPPGKKLAAKTPVATPATPAQSTPETSTPNVLTSPPAEAQPAKSPEAEVTPSPGSKLEPAVEQVKASVEESMVSPTTKDTSVSTTKKVVKRIVKRKVVKPKTPASSKAAPAPATKGGETDEIKVEEGPKDEDSTSAKDADLQKMDVVCTKNVGSAERNEPSSPKVDDDGKVKMDVENHSDMDAGNAESQPVKHVTKFAGSHELSGTSEVKKGELSKEEVNNSVGRHGSEKVLQDDTEVMDGDHKSEKTDGDQKLEKTDDDQKSEKLGEDDPPTGEGMEDYGDEEGFVEPGEEDLQDDDEPDTVDEIKASDEEHKELAATAKERKIKKELEIFVGGLDREVSEDDVKKAFEKVGDVVEVRLLKEHSTNKNRGFAFVRFATKDQAKRALSEMKNPVIRGKRCGTAPNEDNDTLFLGNICNTWTKEAIRQKLKDYSVEGVEDINLIQDPRHEGLSRGFCFIHFACHADAMFAYKRLQKSDAIFGHTERTAKVAFAEPVQEPDPEVMAKVKSVFVDGLPPHWDEDRVRKHFKCYGEIERITLARNMASAKRKDFGFVDFTTHEAAVACIEDLKSKELVDGNSKAKVKARLSNPQPKTQAVKGGMCGGFRIGRPTGRSSGRSGPSLNRGNFQHGRPLRGQFNEPVGPYGRRVPYRAMHGASGGGAEGRTNLGGSRHAAVDRGFSRPVPSLREPFPLEDGGYSRPFLGRHYDDPYLYDDRHGFKRPFYMTDQDPGYMEPNRVRPRFDYSDSGHETHFRDNFGAGSSLYSSGYYGSDYGARPTSSFNGRDRPYGGGSGYYY